MHPEINLKEFILFARNDKQNNGIIPMPTFAGRP